MGIYPQPNSWLCGPFALKHALMVFGLFENEWAIARAAGSDPGGTDERDLARAARQYDCSVRMVRVHYAEDAREELIHHLGQGMPTLLCIEQWDHWVTVMYHDGDHFVLFDSRGPHVIRVLTWEELEPKWRYREDSGETIYDLHPVVARSMQQRPAAVFSLDRARWLAQPEHAGLARQWSDYGKLLLSHGRSCHHDDNHDLFATALGTALQAREDAFVESVERHTQSGESKETRRVLERLRFVADTYGLTIDVGQEAEMVTAVERFIISRLRIARSF